MKDNEGNFFFEADNEGNLDLVEIKNQEMLVFSRGIEQVERWDPGRQQHTTITVPLLGFKQWDLRKLSQEVICFSS